jgi:two-component system sensor histidine kinase/response regulator
MAKLLIVDDEPSSRAVLHDLLLPDAYEVTEAESGSQALALAHILVPDVIITDVMMPDMDGFELCRRLRADEATRTTPIVAVTALGSKGDMARALDAGATDFISKPVNGVEVRARIRSMVRIAQEQATLRQLLTLRNDLTNMVIHDLRGPLQVMFYSAESFERALPKGFKALARMRTQIIRLQHLIDELLLVAKSEAGVLVAHRAAVDAADLIGLVVEDCRPIAESSDIRLITNAETSRLYIDPALMRRCLENLVLNAIKFSPRGSTVVVNCQQTDEDFWFEVQDEGAGVPTEERATIFERFSVGAQSASNISQIGLGLAFCKIAVEAHGGTISVRPAVGPGSVFRVTLPPMPSELQPPVS